MKIKGLIIIMLFLFAIAKGNNAVNPGVDPADLQKITEHIKAEIIKEMIANGSAPDESSIEKDIEEGKLKISVPISFTAYVPIYEKDFITGDLNSDGQEDIVTPVYSEYGASGTATEYWIFVYQDNTLYFFKKYGSGEIAEVVKGLIGEYGSFYLTEIKEGSLLGRCDVWLSDDAKCCPSVHYIALIDISNGIKLIEKVQVKE